MNVISRPFNKELVENRELAVIISSALDYPRVKTELLGQELHRLRNKVCRVLYTHRQEEKNDFSYDELRSMIPHSEYVLDGLAMALMQLANEGVVEVVVVGLDLYHYRLSQAMIELQNEILSAVQSR